MLLFITALVCAVPAGAYWFMRKTWMPELTRFVWLAWLVIGFALALAFRRRWLGVIIGGLGLFIVAATAAVVLYMSLKPA